jgi:hypothetical protein
LLAIPNKVVTLRRDYHGRNRNRPYRTDC